jgi:hypothetical protein
MASHPPPTGLSQEALIWVAAFADQLRAERPGRFAVPDQGRAAEEVARTAWDRGEAARRSAEQAAARWLASQTLSAGWRPARMRRPSSNEATALVAEFAVPGCGSAPVLICPY